MARAIIKYCNGRFVRSSVDALTFHFFASRGPAAVGCTAAAARLAMGIQEEYAAIAEGMRNGTLPPAGEDPRPELWIASRYRNSFLSTSSPGQLSPGFGEQFHANIRSSTAYSFGNCARSDAAKGYVSQELSKGEDISPGPLAYKIPTNMGPDGAAKTVSIKAPMVLFGSDPKETTDLRELKACGVFEGTTVAGDLKKIRDRVHNRV